MKKIFIMIVFVLFFVVSIAEAADWVLITLSNGGDKIYIDEESIKHNSKTTIKVWEKHVPEGRTFEKPFNSKKVTQLLVYREYDCEQKRKRKLQSNFFFEDGSKQEYQGPHEWSYVIPDTVAEEIIQYICKKGK
jgi:hypothetical protein